MNRRPHMLIVTCILVLSGLVAVQIYLLRNTYHLGTANYRNQIVAAILKIQSEPAYQRIDGQYLGNLMNLSLKLDAGMISKQQFLQQLQQDDLKVSRQLDSLIKDHSILADVGGYARYTSIVVKGAIILKESDTPLIISAPGDKNAELISIGFNTGTAEQSNGNTTLSTTYKLSRALQIPVLSLTVIRQLTVVGGLSLVLLVSVVVLFYLVLLSAYRQRQLAELRTDLVNNITHELKTPLSSMSIAIKTLTRPEVNDDPQKRKELVGAMERQHQKLSRIVDRVMESAMTGAIQTEQTVNITDFLLRYNKDLQSDVSMNIPFSVCYVKGTEELIESVLDNLLQNAQKYSRKGAPILISAKEELHRYRIDIQDEGRGIEKQYQHHLFEKFYRVPEKNLHTVKGIGLGLYLSKQAMHHIGGDVQLTRSSPAGSVFTIFLIIV